MTKKYFFSPRVILPTYKYMEFHSKQNPKANFGFFTTPQWGGWLETDNRAISVQLDLTGTGTEPGNKGGIK